MMERGGDNESENEEEEDGVTAQDGWTKSRGGGGGLSRQGDSPGETFLSPVLERGRHCRSRRRRDVKGTQHQTSKRLPGQALL